MDRIIELAEKYSNEMIANRRKIHKNPELGGQEVDTSNFIVEELEKLGIESKKRICQNGDTRNDLW